MAEPFKDRLGPAAVRRLADQLHQTWGGFQVEPFVARATDGLARLELKARVEHLARALRPALPDAFPDAVAILTGALGPPAPLDDLTTDAATGVRGFAMMALTRFVSLYGLDHFEPSMAALHAMTQRFSAEFDIRFFLEAHPEATWARLHAWTRDPSAHVRRLTSEGTRPRLPWAPRIPGAIDDPAPGLAILERLRDDPERYVQRSVANHLNDVSKDHPARVLALAGDWLADAPADRAWIVRHALRSRLKAADPAALGLFGYADPPAIALCGMHVEPQVAFEGQLPYTFSLWSHADQRILIDVIVHYVKARGERRPKVFRVADRAISADQRVEYDRTLDFRSISTRVHYPGVHRLEVRVNGRVLGSAEFALLPP